MELQKKKTKKAFNFKLKDQIKTVTGKVQFKINNKKIMLVEDF